MQEKKNYRKKYVPSALVVWDTGTLTPYFALHIYPLKEFRVCGPRWSAGITNLPANGKSFHAPDLNHESLEGFILYYNMYKKN